MSETLGYDDGTLRRWARGLTTARLVVDPRQRQTDGFCISTRYGDAKDLGTVCSLLGITEVNHGWNPKAELEGRGQWSLSFYADGVFNVFVPGFQADADGGAPSTMSEVDEAAFETARAIERTLFRVRRFFVEPTAAEGEILINPATRPDVWADDEMIVHRVVISGMASVAKSVSICRSATGFWVRKTGGALDETVAKFTGNGIGEQRIARAALDTRRALLDHSIGEVEEGLCGETDFRDGDHYDWKSVSEVSEKSATDAADQPYLLMKVKTGRRSSIKLRFIGHDASVARAFFQPVADRITSG